MKSRSTRSRYLVLYVEDEETDAYFMNLAFASGSRGATLRHVWTGTDALKYLSGEAPYDDREKHPFPCVVLLDLHLPGISGFEVLSWMRQQPHCKETPVLIFTSSNASQDEAKARELGADGFVVKPASAVDFARVAEGVKKRVRELRARQRV